ncbi:UDP-GlcNAc:betaGal beta-1,3-N-acetylglucosaminyltransferase-like protein 1 [Armadillidium nasatum]|uniref:UDP-GlcNAc:betaGal beta-1,3-N-acetylglucosaminyltransferase-like protein 1 n=1 Tax=Armadillidium nasatum TaxID=96803 RepID=A0A5N5SI62_9CRUS|nr:UDP-GlcNAc:betaGal beta-1,3-N-acetylglucosaminyltransferase-like protein 1 [Armadillidium nasatum]
MPPDIDVNIFNSYLTISIILPIYNAGYWLDECLSSILVQEHDLKLEVSIFFDSCTDNSVAIFEKWFPKFEKDFMEVKISKEENEKPKGVGYAKNKCVEQSNGEYLCFLDADDIMLPNRLKSQYNLAINKKDELIGCKFRRIPEGSTNRFTKWANSLTKGQLNTQIFTSNGPTIIMPTWFCHRSVYDKVGGFEEGRAIPEDLIFFYKHLRLGGGISRCDEELLIYRYHEDATTFSIHERTIWDIRVKELEGSCFE